MDRIIENHHTAKLAGMLYVILVCIMIFGVPSEIYVPKDSIATANNLLAKELPFRIGIASHLLSSIALVYVVLLLYRIFRLVDNQLAWLMVIPVIIQLPIVLILESFNVAALMILKSEHLSTPLAVIQKQELSFLMLRLHAYGIGTSQLYWGLWLIPFGILVNLSKAIPRIFGYLLIINGVGYVLEAFSYILLQRPDYLLIRQFARCTFIGLPLTMLWILIKGIQNKKVTSIDLN